MPRNYHEITLCCLRSLQLRQVSPSYLFAISKWRKILCVVSRWVLRALRFPAQRSQVQSLTKSKSRRGVEVTHNGEEEWKEKWKRLSYGRVEERLHGGMGSGNLREVTAPSLCSSVQRWTLELWDGWRGISKWVWQQSHRLPMFQWVQSDSSVRDGVCALLCLPVCLCVCVCTGDSSVKMVVSVCVRVCKDGIKKCAHTYIHTNTHSGWLIELLWVLGLMWRPASIFTL